MFLNNRHYDPSTGVFVSVDPLVNKTMQPYIYGAANPIRFSDPSGLEPCPRTPTGCRDSHAYAKKVHRSNTIRKDLGEYSTDCHYECFMGAGGTGRHYDPTSVSGDPFGTNEEIGGCNGFANCIAGPAFAAAGAGALLGVSVLGGAVVSCGVFIAWCAWMTAAPVTGAANVGVEMSGGPNSASPLGVADDLGITISRQAQARHIFGTSDWAGGRRGGYFASFDDAQRVLDAVHDGSAQVIGRTRGGDLLVRVDDVFGYNNNFEAGYVDQLTNVFVVKGSTTVSVFPTSPTAGG